MGRTFKSIRGKLIASFSVVIVLVILQGIFTFNNLQNSNKATKEILEREIPLLIADEQLVIYMTNRIAASRGYIMTGDNQYKQSFMEYTERSEATQQQLRDLNGSQESLDTVDQTVAWRKQITDTIFPQFERGDEEGAEQSLLAADGEAQRLMGDYESYAKKPGRHYYRA